MNLIQAVFLGVLQGLTEFLPVSSSGHLAITQKLLPGFSQPGVLFDVVLHAGTLLSILFYFRKRIFKLDSAYLKMIVIGTLPAVAAGMLFQDLIESSFLSIKLVGVALFVTALMNYLIDSRKGRVIKLNKGSTLVTQEAFLIGLFQALAIIPGISRSGSTIFAGVSSGLKKDKAAEFSFLLSVPAVFGANILQVYKYSLAGQIQFSGYTLGFLAAAISGYFAIRLVHRFLSTKRFKIFSVYCLLLGLVVLFSSSGI